MRQFFAYLVMLVVCCVVTGCGGEDFDGHASDETPGGVPTLPQEAVTDDASFEDYAAQNANPID